MDGWIKTRSSGVEIDNGTTGGFGDSDSFFVTQIGI